MKLRDARLQLHYALQGAAAVGRTLLPPCDDDSHTSFVWSTRHEALVQGLVGGRYRSGLRLRDLTLLVIDGEDRILDSCSLRGRTLEDAFRFYEERVGVALPRPEGLPEHPIAMEGVFAPYEEHLVSLASLYGRAAAILDRLGEKHPMASEVRCWPHHFDIATLIPIGSQTFGVGFLGGDDALDEPYWYVYATPEPASFPNLTIGSWHSGEWHGAVLTGGHEDGVAEAFLDEAIAALTI
jgi:hypothetical protein